MDGHDFGMKKSDYWKKKDSGHAWKKMEEGHGGHGVTNILIYLLYPIPY